MCRFCKVDENGENTDEYLFVKAKDEGLSVDIGLYLFEGRKQIAAQVNYNGLPVDEEEWFQFDVNYCPVCGRKL